MQYVVNNEKLMEPLWKKGEYAKMKILEYYIASINLECWVQYKTRMLIDHIQPYLIANMSMKFYRAFKVLHI